MPRAPLLLTLTVLLPAAARAQGRTPAPGDSVRMEVYAAVPPTEDGLMTRRRGRILGFEGDAVRLLAPSGDTLRLARLRIRRVQVWEGTGASTLRGLAYGTVVGALALGIWGAAAKADSGLSGLSEGSTGGSAEGGLVIGLVGGAVSGALVGALVGSNIRHGRWRDATLPKPLAPVRRDTLGAVVGLTRNP